MKFVNYSEAAKIAGVTRQAINDLKNVNIKHTGKYPFFKFSTVDGKPGIDIEDPAWLDYLNRNKAKRVRMNQKKQQPIDSKGKVNPPVEKNPARFQNLLIATVEAVKEIYGATGDELQKLTDLIESKFEAMG